MCVRFPVATVQGREPYIVADAQLLVRRNARGAIELGGLCSRDEFCAVFCFDGELGTDGRFQFPLVPALHLRLGGDAGNVRLGVAFRTDAELLEVLLPSLENLVFGWRREIGLSDGHFGVLA